jgi:nucleotide-binding universal stress UspA family protein
MHKGVEMLNKILVPLDGSNLGELALNYAAELAKSMNSEVHLVSVCDRADKEFRNMYDVYLEKVSEEFRSSLPGAITLPKVQTIVIDGQPDSKILDYAIENNINLIVMVSHGHSGIMPWATGSTASKIIQKSAIPILLIRASDNVDTKQVSGLFRKILVPLDGSTISEAVLPYVKEIAAYTNSEIILLRVLEQGQHVRTIGGLDHFAYTDQQVEEMRQETVVYLNEMNQKLSKDGFTVQTVVKTGDVAQVIIETTIQENVSIVAMSSHGKSAAIKWVLGSVSNKILQAGKKPLLLVRPSEKS